MNQEETEILRSPDVPDRAKASSDRAKASSKQFKTLTAKVVEILYRSPAESWTVAEIVMVLYPAPPAADVASALDGAEQLGIIRKIPAAKEGDHYKAITS